MPTNKYAGPQVRLDMQRITRTGRRGSMFVQIRGLLGWLLVSIATGILGAIASVNAAAFYGQLVRPGWAPPAGLFGPVWSVLYVLMGIAAWLVWKARGFHGAQTALRLFLIQLVANALWSWLFFAWHQGALAFIDVLILWSLIAVTTAMFWRISVIAGLLFLPYLAWVSFAALLNYAVWQLNPALL